MKKQSIMRVPMKNSSVMKTNPINKGVKKAARRLALGCLLLFASLGSIVAQNDNHYVIKRIDGTTVHYLAHNASGVVDATTFDPETCVWYSSNNYNYYFMNGDTRMYLKAPLSLNGTISVATNPGTTALNNTTYDYFFYDWDHGLARGIQHVGGVCPPEYNSSGSQCWQVVWVSYESNQWKMSSVYGYDPTPNSARFLRETETEYPETISNESGGVGNLADFSMNYPESHPLNGEASAYSYTLTPAYNYYHIDGLGSIPEETYYYYNGGWQDHAPTSTNYNDIDPSSYAWSIECEGNTQYLSFAEDSELLSISGNNMATPTLYYRIENTTGVHKLATLTLTVTYPGGVTQTRTATVTVKTHCQNPTVLNENTVVTYVGATISWLPSADEYKVFWKKHSESTWVNVTVGDVTSYTISGLEYNIEYDYMVQATCDNDDPTAYSFTTLKEPGLMVTGNIFGGGRMADVGGKTEIVIVNCDSIGGIFGGNDIAGEVQGADGSTITLGVNTGGTYASYGTTPPGVMLRLGSVYGGGNGYYAYDGTSFVPATADYTSQTVNVGASVKEMTPLHQVGDVVWTNNGTAPVTLDFPSIVKTQITVSGDYIKADSIFGGAKNAFLTTNSGDGSLITINGGTIMAVFGGNNFGGKQGYGKHHIVVNQTSTNLAASINNTATTGYGCDFGIRYLFGGGNKVYGSTTNVEIFGGQCDTIFAGGNSADVYAANVTVNCTIAANSGTNYTYGNVYSNAISTYSGGVITPKPTGTSEGQYNWDGFAGIYNVRTLFGGNNMATFDSNLNGSVPTINLTSGSMGTVYGGGNAGDMWGLSNDDGSGGSLVIEDEVVKYGTHVKMNSATILVDILYGGCQMSNVRYGTWVEIKNGHVGTVYGGCNISGDVGSTRENPDAQQFIGEDPNEDYQKVFGGTYVVASGGTVYKNLFGGGNGYYHCLGNDGTYISGINYTGHNYIGLHSPTHNETHAIIETGSLVKGSVYAGGNLACVGFDNSTVGDNPYPKFVGLSYVNMKGGTVNGSVYGGCNMSNVHGSCAALASGGTIGTALYGGNDRMGRMAQISNRVFPDVYKTASDDATSLEDPRVCTYVGLTGDPTIPVVFGGSNGYYKYFDDPAAAAAYTGPLQTVVSCDTTNLPIQQNIFVDVGIDGGDANGAHIGTVYGGGDGVTVTGFITVFQNVKTNPIGYSNVGNIFGGNNKGDLELVPDIILLNGQVNTVYGGCNEGAMTANNDFLKTIGSYEDIGSYVRLLESYDPDDDPSTTNFTPNIKVMDAIYGGCRMNGVTNNSLVLVEGGNFSNVPLFGGSDISGAVSGFSRVAVTGGTVGRVYGGGNGYYTYDNGNVYTIPTSGAPVLVATGVTTAPTCVNSGADILDGNVGASGSGNEGQVFGGGYGKDTQTTGNVIVNVGNIAPSSSSAIPTIYGDIYGGSAFGNVNTAESSSNHYTTTVNFLNGTLYGNVYGGGLGRKAAQGVTAIEAKEYGKVYVNISNSTQDAENCFIDLRQANVYGCNNANGSPQDDVEVHVYKTGYTTGDYDSQSGTLYAIDQVFGGGNQADYTPENGNEYSTKKTLVHVHECLNTIRRVFGGGNAAAATGVSAIIEGGRFDYVFGGGNGEVTAANIGNGGTSLEVQAGITNHLFGGSNSQGVISGDVNTDINGSNVGEACAQNITEFFGGSNATDLYTDVNTVIECGSGLVGTIYGGCNVADITGNVTLTIQGGTFTKAYGGSKGRASTDPLGAKPSNITGNVTLNLEGGTIGTAFGGSNINGNITGTITVNVIDIEDCPLEIDTIFGAGNLTNYVPTTSSITSPVINVMHIVDADGVSGSVFGGGNLASVTANPQVNIGYDATTMASIITALEINTSSLTNFPRAYVNHNIFGGGNAAGITGNTTVNVYNGQVCQSIPSTGSVGIYGGCNSTGTVTGNTTLNILGGTVGKLTTRANIHGGGYGQPTSVAGNVTVNFGEILYDTSSGDEIHNDYPKLYGDVYGGSALGSVNTSASNTTTVNILNGTISGTNDNTYGNIYGGGLGSSSVAALVKGVVHVNVGEVTTAPSTGLKGKARLIYANVYGCNNVNGSPQDDTYVDIYQTDHIEGTNTVHDNDYAIRHVFGGGNAADYAPENGSASSSKKAHVYVHGCENTIKYSYGGGNAADAVGVQTLIEGGHFNEVYGGGNGLVAPANIGNGGIGLTIAGGTVGYMFDGCNKHGTCSGPINQPAPPTLPQGAIVCEQLFVEDKYFGDNEAEHYGDIVHTITCAEAADFHYKRVYAGSRWAIVYGDIKLTVQGGTIEWLFGGSKGYNDDNILADVRRFPSQQEISANPGKYSEELIAYVTAHPEVVGTGGNIELTINGGTIGNVIGGCDELGNVEGKITVIVEESGSCPLFVGDVYGASYHAGYAPLDNTVTGVNYKPTSSNPVSTPEVKILKGTIGGTAQFGRPSAPQSLTFEGNVFGGSNEGNIVSNTIVIIGKPINQNEVTIEGNVYGGGNLGNVDGNTEVIIVPTP